MHCGRLASAALLVFSSALGAQAPSAEWNRAFDRLDRDSRQLLSILRCAQLTSRARGEGLLGPADSLGDVGICVENAGRSIGIFLTVDTLFARPSRFSAADLTTRVRNTAPLDTAAILALARAQWKAIQRGAGAYIAEDRKFAPVVFRTDGDSIAAWLMPMSVLTASPLSVGGERGYIFTPDGRTIGREIDAFDDYRRGVLSDTGVVHIRSRSDSLPTFSELVLANSLNVVGRTVSIDLARISSVLMGRGAQAFWFHQPRRP